MIAPLVTVSTLAVKSSGGGADDRLERAFSSMSDVQPPRAGAAGKPETRAEAAPPGWGPWPMLLGLIVAVSPLVVIAVLQIAVDLPEALIGAVVLMSLLLVAGVALLLRPRALDGRGETNAGQHAPPTPPLAIEPEDSFAGPIPRDPLTSLPTFQPFSRRLLEEFRYVKHADAKLAVVLVDVNHLSEINAQFGAEAGDQTLRHVTACLQVSKRRNDVLARMGDDEFGLLLLDCGKRGARAFVERVQQWLARESLTVQAKGRASSLWIGICAGAAVCDQSTATADEALTVAVDRLNAAREERDRRRQQWERSA